MNSRKSTGSKHSYLGYAFSTDNLAGRWLTIRWMMNGWMRTVLFYVGASFALISFIALFLFPEYFIDYLGVPALKTAVLGIAAMTAAAGLNEPGGGGEP